MTKRILSTLMAVMTCLTLLAGIVPEAKAAEASLSFGEHQLITNGVVSTDLPSGFSVTYDAQKNTATLTLNNATLEDVDIPFHGGRSHGFQVSYLSHLYIVLADGSVNNLTTNWPAGGNYLYFLSAPCDVTISGSGTLNTKTISKSGVHYSQIDNMYGFSLPNKTLTICGGATVNISLEGRIMTIGYGIEGNVVVSNASLSIDINNHRSGDTACITGNATLHSGEISLKAKTSNEDGNGNIVDQSGKVNVPGAIPSTDSDGKITYTLNHTSWSYAASGNTISATCTSDHSCAYKTNPLQLTLNADDRVFETKLDSSEGTYFDIKNTTPVPYSGASVSNQISIVTGVEPFPITYSGTASPTTPPSMPGTYQASIKLGGCTATDEFTISKAPLEYDTPDPNVIYESDPTGVPGALLTKPLTYTGQPQNLIFSTSHIRTKWYKSFLLASPCGSMEFSLDGENWSTAIPTATDAGEYKVYWRVVVAEEYSDRYTVSEQDSGTVTARIKGKTMTGVTADGYTGTYDGHPHSISVTLPEEAVGAEITYKGPNDADYSSTNPAFTDAGTYVVAYKVEKKNYEPFESTATVKIEPKSVTVSGITAKNRPYDGTATAELDYSNVSIEDKIDGDDLTVTATGTFADASAADGKTVTISDLKLGGADAKNYVLAASGQQSSSIADITPRDITVSITPGGGVYGGTITGASATLHNVVSPDYPTVTLTYTGTANDGTAYTGTVVPTLAGSYTVTAAIEDSNYNLTGETSAAFVIEKAGVTPPTIASKEYTGETLTAAVSDTERYTVTENNGGINVGGYPVVLMLTDAHNYKWSDGTETADKTLTFSIGIIGQTPPPAPAAKEVTSSTVELNPITESGFGAVEYTVSTDSTAPADGWQASPVFTGLTKNTTYFFFARYAGDANHNPSSASSPAAEIKTLDTFTVSFEGAGGTVAEGSGSGTADIGSAVTAPDASAVTREGHTLIGWAAEPDGEAVYKPGGEIREGVETLYAVWSINSYRLIFDPNGGEGGYSRTYEYTSPIDAPADPVRYGYTFLGWDALIPDTMPAHDLTIRARWKSLYKPVTITFSGSGLVSPAESLEVVSGETVDFVFTPGRYMKVHDVTVNGESVGAVTELSLIITEETAVHVIFAHAQDFTQHADKPVGRPQEPSDVGQTGGTSAGTIPAYRDVYPRDWFYDSVLWTWQRRLDDSQYAFNPNTAAMRGTIVEWLWRLQNRPIAYGAPFTDTTAMSAAWAASHGIVNGYGNGTFGSDDTVTREQMAAILMRYAAALGKNTAARAKLTAFTDAGAISAYAVDAVQWAAASGFINGYPDGTLRPQGNVTRAELAAILMRFSVYYGV